MGFKVQGKRFLKYKPGTKICWELSLLTRAAIKASLRIQANSI